MGRARARAALPVPVLRPARQHRPLARASGRGRATTSPSSRRLYTGDDARVRLVLQQLQDKLRDARTMRALGFCVSIAHAEFMARRFTEAGLPSQAVSAEHRQRHAPQGAGGPAEGHAARALRRGPVQRRRRPAGGRHAAVPPPHRERTGVPAAARPRPAPVRGQGLRHGARLHRPVAPASSASTCATAR